MHLTRFVLALTLMNVAAVARAATLPAPVAGEYRCSVTRVALQMVMRTELVFDPILGEFRSELRAAPDPTVKLEPSPLGSVRLDGKGRYTQVSNQGKTLSSGTYSYDKTRNRPVFQGALADNKEYKFQKYEVVQNGPVVITFAKGTLFHACMLSKGQAASGSAGASAPTPPRTQTLPNQPGNNGTKSVPFWPSWLPTASVTLNHPNMLGRLNLDPTKVATEGANNTLQGVIVMNFTDWEAVYSLNPATSQQVLLIKLSDQTLGCLLTKSTERTLSGPLFNMYSGKDPVPTGGDCLLEGR